jgi:hypothetical protein
VRSTTSALFAIVDDEFQTECVIRMSSRSRKLGSSGL